MLWSTACLSPKLRAVLDNLGLAFIGSSFHRFCFRMPQNVATWQRLAETASGVPRRRDSAIPLPMCNVFVAGASMAPRLCGLNCCFTLLPLVADLVEGRLLDTK